MNKVDQRAFSSTNTGVAGYEIYEKLQQEQSELSQISSMLEQQLSTNWNLINDLRHSAGRLSSIEELKEGKIVEETKPKSLVETLREQIDEFINLNDKLRLIVEHFNKVI